MAEIGDFYEGETLPAMATGAADVTHLNPTERAMAMREALVSPNQDVRDLAMVRLTRLYQLVAEKEQQS